MEASTVAKYHPQARKLAAFVGNSVVTASRVPNELPAAFVHKAAAVVAPLALVVLLAVPMPSELPELVVHSALPVVAGAQSFLAAAQAFVREVLLYPQVVVAHALLEEVAEAHSHLGQAVVVHVPLVVVANGALASHQINRQSHLVAHRLAPND